MSTTPVYLAARYSRHPEMRTVRERLEPAGYRVTSRWIDMHGGKYPSSFTVETLNDDPDYCGGIATHDMEDVRAADVVISFTESGGGKGGRHVEFGIGLALGKRMIIVGPREHVFHAMPGVEAYTTLDEALAALGIERAA